MGWSLFALFLVFVGGVLYYWLPPATRWTLENDTRTLIAEEGDVLATCTTRDNEMCGPVQIWDVATGKEIARFLDGVPRFLMLAETKDNHGFFVIIPGDRPEMRRIVSIDLKDRTARHVDAPLGEFDSALFSLACDFVAVRRGKPGGADATYTIADTASGRIVERFSIALDIPEQKGDYWKQWGLTPECGVFSDDGRFFIVNGVHGEGRAMRMVDTRTGKAHTVEDARARGIALDSRTVVAQRGDDETWIWDLEAVAWRAPLEAEALDTLRFSGDGRWLASVPPKHHEPVPIRFFDLRTGKLHWELQSITANSEEIQDEQFSPDGRFFVLPTQPAPGQRRIALYDVERKQLRYERTTNANFGNTAFSADSHLLVSALPSEVEVVDVESGTARYTITMPESLQFDALPSRDCQTLFVQHEPRPPEPSLWQEWLDQLWPWQPDEAGLNGIVTQHAYDLATGRELWQLPTPIPTRLWYGKDSVVTMHERYERNPNVPAVRPVAVAIHCWDVPPRKRVGWIVGVPVAIGVLLVGTGAGWQRWRRSRATARPAAAPAPPMPPGL
jgi:hypothetical protein